MVKKCETCLETLSYEDSKFARRDGLCAKHGSPPKKCSKCNDKLARLGGLCRSCGDKETAVYCKTLDCKNLVYRGDYCGTCYTKINGVSLRINCKVEGCEIPQKTGGRCYKHINSEKTKQKYRDRQNKYEKEKYLTDPNYKLAKTLRNRLKDLISENKASKLESSLKLVGCSLENLKLYLEEKFVDDMSWDNCGKWHIDHIKPCSSFDLTDIEQQKICFHYTNLQPLWAIDNLQKGSIF